MRSKTETGRKINSDGTDKSTDQSSVSVEEEQLEWHRPSPNSDFIKELTNMIKMASTIIKKDTLKTLKELKKMDKNG